MRGEVKPMHRIEWLAATLFAAVALLLLAPQAQASTPGEEISPEFNHAGLFVATYVAGDQDVLIHRSTDPEPIRVSGEYTDSSGSFAVPQEGGLSFPPFTVDFGLFDIDGEFALADDGSGSYDEATGHMDLDLPLALTLSIDDLETFGKEIDFPLGEGPLTCEFAPLETSFSTEDDWPHPGKAYEDKAGLTDGAIAGNWRKKPPATAVQGDQAICNIIGGFMKPVGGLWLANSTEPIDEMPGWNIHCPVMAGKALQLSCYPPDCPEGMLGTFPDCVQPGCPPGQVGTPPYCSIVDPATVLTKVTLGPKKAKLRAGKSSKLRVGIRVIPGLDKGPFRIKLHSSNRQVKVPKSVLVNFNGRSGAVAIKLKATGKARGKAIVTASYGDLKAAVKVNLKKPLRKKKKAK